MDKNKNNIAYFVIIAGILAFAYFFYAGQTDTKLSILEYGCVANADCTPTFCQADGNTYTLFNNPTCYVTTGSPNGFCDYTATTGFTSPTCTITTTPEDTSGDTSAIAEGYWEPNFVTTPTGEMCLGDVLKVSETFLCTKSGYLIVEAGMEYTGASLSISRSVSSNECNPDEPWYANKVVYMSAGQAYDYSFFIKPYKIGNWLVHTAYVKETECGAGGDWVKGIEENIMVTAECEPENWAEDNNGEACTDPIMKTCDDGSKIISYRCIDGVYDKTTYTCPLGDSGTGDTENPNIICSSVGECGNWGDIGCANNKMEQKKECVSQDAEGCGVIYESRTTESELCLFCGDGTCDATIGESFALCPADCEEKSQNIWQYWWLLLLVGMILMGFMFWRKRK